MDSASWWERANPIPEPPGFVLEMGLNIFSVIGEAIPPALSETIIFKIPSLLVSNFKLISASVFASIEFLNKFSRIAKVS